MLSSLFCLTEYAFGRTILQALLSMSPGFGTLGWRCHLADIPGQLDHPCCASFGLAICHTGSVFWLGSVTVTSACTHWECVFWLGSAICRRDIGMYVCQASPRGCALVSVANLPPSRLLVVGGHLHVCLWTE